MFLLPFFSPFYFSISPFFLVFVSSVLLFFVCPRLLSQPLSSLSPCFWSVFFTISTSHTSFSIFSTLFFVLGCFLSPNLFHFVSIILRQLSVWFFCHSFSVSLWIILNKILNKLGASFSFFYIYSFATGWLNRWSKISSLTLKLILFSQYERSSVNLLVFTGLKGFLGQLRE